MNTLGPNLNKGLVHIFAFFKINVKLADFKIQKSKNYDVILFWIMHPTTYLVGCVIQKRITS